MKIKGDFYVLLHDLNTASPAMRSLAEIKIIFLETLVFSILKFEIGPHNLLLLQKFSLILVGFWVF